MKPNSIIVNNDQEIHEEIKKIKGLWLKSLTMLEKKIEKTEKDPLKQALSAEQQALSEGVPNDIIDNFKARPGISIEVPLVRNSTLDLKIKISSSIIITILSKITSIFTASKTEKKYKSESSSNLFSRLFFYGARKTFNLMKRKRHLIWGLIGLGGVVTGIIASYSSITFTGSIATDGLNLSMIGIGIIALTICSFYFKKAEDKANEKKATDRLMPMINQRLIVQLGVSISMLKAEANSEQKPRAYYRIKGAKIEELNKIGGLEHLKDDIYRSYSDREKIDEGLKECQYDVDAIEIHPTILANNIKTEEVKKITYEKTGKELKELLEKATRNPRISDYIFKNYRQKIKDRGDAQKKLREDYNIEVKASLFDNSAKSESSRSVLIILALSVIVISSLSIVTNFLGIDFIKITEKFSYSLLFFFLFCSLATLIYLANNQKAYDRRQFVNNNLRDYCFMGNGDQYNAIKELNDKQVDENNKKIEPFTKLKEEEIVTINDFLEKQYNTTDTMPKYKALFLKKDIACRYPDIADKLITESDQNLYVYTGQETDLTSITDKLKTYRKNKNVDNFKRDFYRYSLSQMDIKEILEGADKEFLQQIYPTKKKNKQNEQNNLKSYIMEKLDLFDLAKIKDIDTQDLITKGITEEYVGFCEKYMNSGQKPPQYIKKIIQAIKKRKHQKELKNAFLAQNMQQFYEGYNPKNGFSATLSDQEIARLSQGLNKRPNGMTQKTDGMTKKTNGIKTTIQAFFNSSRKRSVKTKNTQLPAAALAGNQTHITVASNGEKQEVCEMELNPQRI